MIRERIAAMPNQLFVVLVASAALVQVATAAHAAEFRRLSVKEYRDKMKAGWIGQIAGVCWGAPTEFKFQDKIIPEDKVPKWTPEMINNAFGQDDLYVEMTFLRSMEQYGLDVPIRQAGIDFANSRYPLWCANNAGRTALRKGIAPPDSSHPQGDFDLIVRADGRQLARKPVNPQAATDHWLALDVDLSSLTGPHTRRRHNS